ncbi:protein kinase domain-containing protein [Edaphobacter aggregans]|uniref:protein kinase domain-containing protein n=1 Tax=Edaphobacter aggregans TaxID=570835 RepID=UPI001FDFFD49|nr:protein kinase [Edaphobacter aggregans]
MFGDALDMAPEARRAFLDAACQNEPELKHLVEQLLMEDERAGSFLKKPPFDFSTKVGIHTHTPLTPGTRLGPYEILAAVGAGGMGEVYRARDTRLGRDVAVKILSTRLSSDPDLKWRFEREARAISLLTHPNICCLYDIGCHDGIDFIVMEYLEGETLADRHLASPARAIVHRHVDGTRLPQLFCYLVLEGFHFRLSNSGSLHRSIGLRADMGCFGRTVPTPGLSSR